LVHDGVLACVRRPKRGADAAATFGRRVAAARHELGARRGDRISQERLADLAGLHRTYIGHVERGEVNPSLVNILQIAAALEIDAADLVRDLQPR
jgi:transcriptional regulator with XRE-family HTH domain